MTEIGRPTLIVYRVPCTDLAAMRGFYGGLLGLEEIAFRDGPEGGWAGFQAGRVQIVLLTGAYVEQLGGSPPGKAAREATAPPLRLELPCAAAARALDRLGAVAAGAERDGVGRGPRRTTLRDPMGNAVDVIAPPPEEGSRWTTETP